MRQVEVRQEPASIGGRPWLGERDHVLDGRRKRRGAVFAGRGTDERHILAAKRGGCGGADVDCDLLPTSGAQFPQVVRGDRTGGECVGEGFADPER